VPVLAHGGAAGDEVPRRGEVAEPRPVRRVEHEEIVGRPAVAGFADDDVQAFVAPDDEPRHQVTYKTREDQALTYRLPGDRNPLHSDPSFAARGGFEKPILHCLCTYGFTGRALLHSLCNGDPSRFRSMNARFSRPVIPGDRLTVSMWADGNEALFRTTNQNGDVVIDQGRCTFA